MMAIIKEGNYGINDARGISICSGATYSKRISANTNFRNSMRGIRILDGAVGKEGLCAKTDLKHVVTKNGTITVVVRHAW
jgi:hypothetical protein